MQTLTYSNSFGSIDIGLVKPFILQRIEGISGLGVNIYEQVAPGQNGATYLNSFAKSRNITMNIIIKAQTYDELNTHKKTLTKIFTPFKQSTLQYSNETYEKELVVVPGACIEFSPDAKNRNYQIAKIVLIAHQPFFLDFDFSGETFSVSTPLLIFPLIAAPTFEFETSGTNRIDVNNEGDVETPIEVTFLGPVKNPKLINETTGEFIQVNAELLIGQSLEINTEFGNLSITLVDGSGVRTNGFSYLDLDSLFRFLLPGINTISYTASTGISSTTVTLKYKNRYLGL